MTELAQVARWICIAIFQGKHGVDTVPHGHPRRHDWGNTLTTLRVAMMRSGWSG